MTSFLVFTVCAPHGAWGAASQSSATTAYKASDLDPSKSALIGLIGAALGIGRSRLGALGDALFVHVRVVVRPTRDPRPDFHTVTRGAPPPGLSKWSRFEEVRGHLAGLINAGSMLSRREYWTAGLWTVAVEPREPDGEWRPDILLRAFEAPRWTLHAGRRACPLGLPPDPEVIEAKTPRAALAVYGLPWTRKAGLSAALEWFEQSGARTAGELLLDGETGETRDPAGSGYVRLETRRDSPDPILLAGGRSLPRHRDRLQTRVPWIGSGEEGR